ncbi:hypothetical protein [Nostoc sp. NMS2]|uniref:hypothetical protein n=1 Tax=unclassified Nostoc TaxID=2593658 RepID=UPI003452DDF8
MRSPIKPLYKPHGLYLVYAEFAVKREASYNNFVGFYQVADENGSIDTNGDRTADIIVGQAGYAEAAIRKHVGDIDLTVNNQGTAQYTGTFGPNSLFAPLLWMVNPMQFSIAMLIRMFTSHFWVLTLIG